MGERPRVTLKSLAKDYGAVRAVAGIDLDIFAGEFLTLLGPSGCGKTTTLLMIAGFESPTSGEIRINDEDVTRTPPFRRPVNTVFQSYALFPHMTIFDNVAFGLRMRKTPETKVRQMVSEQLALVQLPGVESRFPRQLSGGQQQRVALARAIINSPQVLLLDEPLGALDLRLRREMQVELKSLQRRLGITFVYVTHDQEEALTMSDRIAVMNDGRIEQLGTGVEIYERPATRFVAGFIGETNLIPAERLAQVGSARSMRVVSGNGKTPAGESTFASIRPERIRLAESGEAALEGRVVDTIYVGSSLKILVTVPGIDAPICVAGAPGAALACVARGDDVRLTWNPDDVVLVA